ncbi:hypothetical protein [Rhizobium sp. Leaf383]|nr:hypothetical protein [Rhizobium sp. Leaf383]
MRVVFTAMLASVLSILAYKYMDRSIGNHPILEWSYQAEVAP